MEKKWLWKRRSSQTSPGETESSESFSSHSARYSDDQDASRESQNESTLSPDVTSEASTTDNKVKASTQTLAEKLSAALVNLSAKEALVKQHAKVAEEAVAGWEKAEKEVATLKQQLEQKTNLKARASHLDGALKECVRQLRQARDEQEAKQKDWESTKAELEVQIRDLRAQLEAQRTKNPDSVDPNLEKENALLKQELEVVKVERDLSTQAAETASKLQLETVKKVAKLEAECRRLQSVARKSGAQVPAALKPLSKHVFEIDMMDDFLEMERLAALPENETNLLKPDSLIQRIDELEKKLEKMEAEKSELEAALDESRGSLDDARRRMAEVEVENDSLKSRLVNVDLLRGEIEKERIVSAELRGRCREMEDELNRNGERRIKEEDVAIAANKLVECRKTIASLGRQLKSLATLEDFLIDVPGLSIEESASLSSLSSLKGRNGSGRTLSMYPGQS